MEWKIEQKRTWNISRSPPPGFTHGLTTRDMTPTTFYLKNLNPCKRFQRGFSVVHNQEITRKGCTRHGTLKIRIMNWHLRETLKTWSHSPVLILYSRAIFSSAEAQLGNFKSPGRRDHSRALFAHHCPNVVATLYGHYICKDLSVFTFVWRVLCYEGSFLQNVISAWHSASRFGGESIDLGIKHEREHETIYALQTIFLRKKQGAIEEMLAAPSKHEIVEKFASFFGVFAPEVAKRMTTTIPRISIFPK